MTDAEFIKRQFEQDSRDKKRIAQGEKHRVKSKRGMKTPSEYLSKKERDKLNGEVKTYNLNKPMSWDEFKQLPDDLRVKYIKSLQQKFGVGDKELGDMFHIHSTAVQKERKRLGIASTKSIGRRKDAAAWEKWTAGDVKTTVAMVLDNAFREEPYVPELKERLIPNIAVAAALGNHPPEETQEWINRASDMLTGEIYPAYAVLPKPDVPAISERLEEGQVPRPQFHLDEEPTDKISHLLELLKKLDGTGAKITIELTL